MTPESPVLRMHMHVAEQVDRFAERRSNKEISNLSLDFSVSFSNFSHFRMITEILRLPRWLRHHGPSSSGIPVAGNPHNTGEGKWICLCGICR